MSEKFSELNNIDPESKQGKRYDRTLNEDGELSEWSINYLEKTGEAIESILEQIRPQIERGDYNLIIGDDVAGRIPSLIISKVLNNIYRQKGYKPPITKFIAGSSTNHPEWRRDKDHFGKLLKDKNNTLVKLFAKLKTKMGVAENSSSPRALLITEFVESGQSIGRLRHALRKCHIPVDICTLGTNISSEEWNSAYHRDYPEKSNDIDNSKQDNFFAVKKYTGIGGDRGGYFYDLHDFSGVKKNPLQLHSKTHISFLDNPVLEEREQQIINESRKYSSKLAAEITENFLHNNKSESEGE